MIFKDETKSSNQIEMTNFQNRGLCLARCLTAAFLLSANLITAAQNKVVVIPLGGDQQPLEPSSPLAPVNPSFLNYRIPPNLPPFSFDVTVSDISTGLVWQRDDIGDSNNSVDWDDAVDYCQDLELGGITDWRLPDIKELQSIVNFSETSPAINDSFRNTDSSNYWSASTVAEDSSSAWVVFFRDGFMNIVTKSQSNFVRCVS